MNEYDKHFKNLPKSVKEIAINVKEYYEVDNKTLFNIRRQERNFMPRHILAYLINKNIEIYNLGQIGTFVRLAPLHHTTVINCLKKGAIEMKYNDKLRERFLNITDINLGVEINTLNELNKYKKLGYRIITAN